LNTLKGSIRQIEKQLYPNWAERLLHRFIRQANKSIDNLKIERKVKDLIERLRPMNKSQNQVKTENQTQAQTENQTQGQMQNVKSDFKNAQSQAHEGPILTNSEPIRNNILNNPIRNENTHSGNKLKNNSHKHSLPKHRHRHRLH
jgi:hypothetical protein